MRKLQLKLENLEVESFAVAKDGAERGTVQGNQATRDYWSCRVDTCSGGMLCECATNEYSYCPLMCETVEASYCAACA